MIEGVDYSTARPSPTGLYQLGKRFAVRYGGPGTPDKWLTASEAVSLRAAGLSIVANAEGSARGLLGGYDTGRAWASSAYMHFRGRDMPADRPVYLSVDWDMQQSEWPTVSAALDGAAEAIGRDRVGIYGGRRAIANAQASGAARWFWQTYAWSGTPTQWLPGVHIQQYRNGVQVAGGDCDLDRALTVDYGQWGQQDQGGTPMAVEADASWMTVVTQGNEGFRGQTRETALASTWEHAYNASQGVKDLLKRPTAVLTPGDITALAAALEPAIEAAVEAVLARTSLVVRPAI